MSEPTPAGSPPPDAGGPAFSSFFVLIGALIGLHASMAATRVTASLYLLKHGHPEWMVGVLLSLFAVAPIGLSLWAGRLADRHGLHRPMGVGVAMALAGTGILVASQQLGALALGALLTGGALSVGAVGIQREVGQLAQDPSQLKRVFAWVALGPALSNALSPVLAGLLIDHAGYRAAFVFALAMPALAWALTQRLPRRSPAHAEAARQAAGRQRRDPWGLLRLPALRRLLVLNVVLAACWDAHSFAVPVIGHARGLTASQIGLVLGAFAAAATVVRVVISAFSARLDEHQALRAAMVLATTVLLGYAWLPGTPGMVAGSALLGLALGSVQPMVLALLHQVTPAERQGEALGVRMLFTNAATVTMPGGFGLLAGATAAAAPMWLMAALLLASFGTLRRLRQDHLLPHGGPGPDPGAAGS